MLDNEQDGVDLATASARLGLTAETIRKRLQRGKIKGFKGADGAWRVTLDKVDSKQDSSSPDYSRRRWVWREPVSGRRVWLSTPIRAPGAPTHLDARYACPAQPVTNR